MRCPDARVQVALGSLYDQAQLRQARLEARDLAVGRAAARALRRLGFLQLRFGDEYLIVQKLLRALAVDAIRVVDRLVPV